MIDNILTALMLTMIAYNAVILFRYNAHNLRRTIARWRGQPTGPKTIDIDEFLDEVHFLTHKYELNAVIFVDDPKIKLYCTDMYGEQHCECVPPDRIARLRIAAVKISEDADELIKRITEGNKQ